MLASEIRTNIKTIVNIPSADTDTDALILAVVNSSYHFIERVRDWTWLKRTSAFQTKNGVVLYPLFGDGTLDVQPGSITEVLDKTNDTKLERAEPFWIKRAFPEMDETTEPWYWWLDGMDEQHGNARQIGIYPTGTATIEYAYLKRLPDLAAADTPLFPDAYHPILQNHALSIVAAREQMPELVKVFAEMAQAGISRMVEEDTGSKDHILQAASRPAARLNPVQFLPVGYGYPE